MTVDGMVDVHLDLMVRSGAMKTDGTISVCNNTGKLFLFYIDISILDLQNMKEEWFVNLILLM